MWLAGHSKGGAVATTAASRLVLGDSAQDDSLPARVRRPRDSSRELSSALKRLSIFTFNAPKALNGPLAEEYEAKTKDHGILHLRFETQGDIVVNLPPSWLGLEHVGLPIPKARDVDKTTAGSNRKVRKVKIAAALVVVGGTLALAAVCWAGLVDGESVVAVWRVWLCVVVAIGFGVRKFAKLKEETQMRHVLSQSICNMDKEEEEEQPLQSNCSYLRLLLVEFQERLGLLNMLSTRDDEWSVEAEKQFLQRTIRVNSLTEEDMSKVDEFLGVYVG